MSESREEMLHSTAKAREQVMIDRLLESFYKHKDEILKATQEKKDCPKNVQYSCQLKQNRCNTYAKERV